MWFEVAFGIEQEQSVYCFALICIPAQLTGQCFCMLSFTMLFSFFLFLQFLFSRSPLPTTYFKESGMWYTYIAPNPTRLAQSTLQFKARMDIELIHETCIHQTIQRQQQSTGKHAHIPEQSVQPRHAVQRHMDHGHIS